MRAPCWQLRPVAGAGNAGEGTVALPRIPPLGVSVALPRLQRALAPLGGRRALVALVLGVIAVVAFATAGASTLVPPSRLTYPDWEAGPLHALHGALDGLLGSWRGINIGLSVVLVAMTGRLRRRARVGAERCRCGRS